jgi:phosphopantothenoylcysteine synthetase/decarboxylase
MRVLITAGATHEPIDPVRFIGNRSSGRMGSALASAALQRGHDVTLILGPVTAPMPEQARRIDVQTARQMHEAVLVEFPRHELLIMAAAVADYRPVSIRQEKLHRGGKLTIELEATEDILAAAGAIRRPDQRTIGFSLVGRDELERSREKLRRKRADLLVHNPTDTMSSATIEATLLYPEGRSEALPAGAKADVAAILLARAAALFDEPPVKKD